MSSKAALQAIVKLGENLRIARKRRGLLPVERVSAAEFWNERRARQVASHGRVLSGEIPQSALFAFGAEQLHGAEFKWPKGGFSALENDDDGEERSASALRR